MLEGEVKIAPVETADRVYTDLHVLDHVLEVLLHLQFKAQLSCQSVHGCERTGSEDDALRFLFHDAVETKLWTEAAQRKNALAFFSLFLRKVQLGLVDFVWLLLTLPSELPTGLVLGIRAIGSLRFLVLEVIFVDENAYVLLDFFAFFRIVGRVVDDLPETEPALEV